MAFTITPNVHVERDVDGIVRHLRHLQEPYTPEAAGFVEARVPTARTLAAQYVRDVAHIYGIDPSQLAGLDKRPEGRLTDEGTLLCLAEEKSIMETTTVSYVQTHFGLPIWGAGISVTLHDNKLRATSSHSTIHFDIDVDKPELKPEAQLERITPDFLSEGFRLRHKDQRPELTRTRLLIYQYEPDKRIDPASRRKDRPLEKAPPTLRLPPAPETIRAGKHCVVVEVLFTLALKGWGEVNWRAFIDPQTGAVVYLRALIACAFGDVFTVDPLTATGDTTITACSPAADLDPLTTQVNFLGLSPPANPGDPQELSGEFVMIQNTDPPNIAPPTAALPAGDFSFSPVTDADDFSAVNAYYHCDHLFRMLQGMGFNIPDYFNGTTFPIPVDHRGEGGGVNAHCRGNATGDGVERFTFGLVDAGCPVGIAAAPRVVWHEFSHALLWDSVHSANFGFAHSAGDSLAAILHDPGSQATDRFVTFPWVGSDRRHDRDITAGWAWGGTEDDHFYLSEQILSTTLLRIYRSVGGDDPHPDASTRRARRQAAARYVAYLIIRAIGSLATDPVTPTGTPDVFATALMDADTGTQDFEGHPGGAFHKVIRWGFEKQGLYQPAGAPTPVTTEGDPPDVDVYIDDGRNGEYPYQRNIWSSTDIWNRLAPDGGTAHETPVLNVSNYMYVRVKNRGTQPANDVVVRGYHRNPGAGGTWPDAWQAMVTAELPASGPIPAGGETIVGPFEWVPQEMGHECLLAYVSATGDLSNADPASLLPCATGPTPNGHLVRSDNNIAMRNVAPVPGGGGGLALAQAFDGRHFWVDNPYDRQVRVQLEVRMPAFLVQRKWQLRFLNPGGASFTLGPRGSREVIMFLEQGTDFSSSDVPLAGEDAVIDVLVSIDQQLEGGMSYAIDPRMEEPAIERLPGLGKKADCTSPAKHLLECLEVPVDEVKAVRVKRITVDIDLAEDC